MNEALGIEILVLDDKTASILPPAFEVNYKYVIVTCKYHVEIRQSEVLSPDDISKYAIHVEVMRAPPYTHINDNNFLTAFKRAYRRDPIDVRKAVRLALKGAVYNRSDV